MFPTIKKIDPAEWHGISGAPFFDTEGNIVGIFCSGDVDNNIIYVLKMSRVMALIDSTLKIEEIEKSVKK